MSQRGREKETTVDLDQYGVEVLCEDRDQSPHRPDKREEKGFPPTPEIFQELAILLQEKGHVCVMFVKPPHWKLKWCQQDYCAWKKAHEKQNKQRVRAAELEAKGHICVQWRETFPAQLIYCQQEPCAGLKQ